MIRVIRVESVPSLRDRTRHKGLDEHATNHEPRNFRAPRPLYSMMPMSVTVLLFASYAEALGATSLAMELPAGATVADVLESLRSRPGADRLPRAPLVAVNQHYARPSSPVAAGDEVAIIPPVAGG